MELVAPSQMVRAASSSSSSSAFHNVGRRMMSRRGKGKIRIISSLSPGTRTPGCFVCCTAPSFCPILSVCPCYNDSEYIHIKRESSKYIFIRENSIEWNVRFTFLILEFVITYSFSMNILIYSDNQQLYHEQAPSVVMKHGSCCGVDPCIYEIQDNVKVWSKFLDHTLSLFHTFTLVPYQ